MLEHNIKPLNKLLSEPFNIKVLQLNPIVLIIYIMTDGSGDYSWIKVYLELLHEIGYNKDNIYLVIYITDYRIKQILNIKGSSICINEKCTPYYKSKVYNFKFFNVNDLLNDFTKTYTSEDKIYWFARFKSFITQCNIIYFNSDKLTYIDYIIRIHLKLKNPIVISFYFTDIPHFNKYNYLPMSEGGCTIKGDFFLLCSGINSKENSNVDEIDSIKSEDKDYDEKDDEGTNVDSDLSENLRMNPQDFDGMSLASHQQYEDNNSEYPIYLGLYNPTIKKLETSKTIEHKHYTYIYLSKSTSSYSIINYILLIYNYFKEITLIKCHNNINDIYIFKKIILDPGFSKHINIEITCVKDKEDNFLNITFSKDARKLTCEIFNNLNQNDFYHLICNASCPNFTTGDLSTHEALMLGKFAIHDYMPHKQNFYNNIILMILNTIEEHVLRDFYNSLPNEESDEESDKESNEESIETIKKFLFDNVKLYLNICQKEIIDNNTFELVSSIIEFICKNFIHVHKLLIKDYNFNYNFKNLILYMNLYIEQNKIFNPKIKNSLLDFKKFITKNIEKQVSDLNANSLSYKYLKYKIKYFNLYNKLKL